MDKKIYIYIIGAIVLIIIGIFHDATIEKPTEPIETPTYAEIISAYNQGKIEGQNAMKNAVILEVLQKGEVSIPYKVDFGDRVEDRVIILMEEK